MSHQILVVIAVLLIVLAALSGLVLVLGQRRDGDIEIGTTVMDNAMEPKRSPALFLVLAVFAGIASWAAWGRGDAPPSTNQAPPTASSPAAHRPGFSFRLPSLPRDWFRPHPRAPKAPKPETAAGHTSTPPATAHPEDHPAAQRPPVDEGDPGTSDGETPDSHAPEADTGGKPV